MEFGGVHFLGKGRIAFLTRGQLEQLAIIDELCVEVLLQDRLLGEQYATERHVKKIRVGNKHKL